MRDLKIRINKKKKIIGACWEWAGSTGSHGYGQISINGKPRLVHRLIFEIKNGRRIKNKLTIDHLCFNKRCFNPRHLEEVTHRENNIRSNGASGKNHRKTHCIRGHEFTKENTNERRRGWRECRTCAAILENRRKSR